MTENHRPSLLVRLLPLGAAVSILAFLFGALMLVNSVRHGNRERDQICRVAQRDNTALRRLLELAQMNSEVTLRSSPERLKVSREFYVKALALIPPVDCEKL